MASIAVSSPILFCMQDAEPQSLFVTLRNRQPRASRVTRQKTHLSADFRAAAEPKRTSLPAGPRSEVAAETECILTEIAVALAVSYSY